MFGAGERAAAPSRAIERFLGHPIMAWVGVVSYGVFLWHQPLYDNVIARHVVDRVPGAPFAAGVVATVAGAVALAAASYYGLERWFLRLKDPRPREGRAAAPARSIAG